MITTAVVVPFPPLLVRELGGIADPVADLRAAVTAALGAALSADPDGVVLVGPPPASGPDLVQPLGVGRRLLDDAGWSGPTRVVPLAPDAADDEVLALAGQLAARPGREVLLLLAEGSARRLDKGPGMLDERAFGFDDHVLSALRAGDPAALTGLDVDLARDLMVAGRGSFRLLGRLGAPAGAEVSYADDPYGVLYPVATWSYERLRVVEPR